MTSVLGRARARTARVPVVLLLSALFAFPGVVLGLAPAVATPLGSGAVLVRILGLTPLTPVPSDTPTPLTVTLQLVNNTDQTLRNVSVMGDRGNPINSQAALDAAIAHPRPPDPFLDSPIRPIHDVTTDLAARASVTVVYQTRTSRQVGDGLCLCADAIYPLYFTVHYPADGQDTVLGAAQTYLPAFGTSTPNPVHVAWVWPLIDRPHRVASDTVFLDDDLATSVSTGRLDRALAVIEALGPNATLTLVLDPDLLDELAVMSTGRYQVQASNTVSAQAGTGAAAARAWLTRLAAVLKRDTLLDVRYTIPDDPDIETLTQHGLAWTTTLPAPAAARVSAALDGFTPAGILAWPARAGVHVDTIADALRRGASNVLLPASSLTALPQSEGGGPVGVAAVSGITGPTAIAGAQAAVAANNALAIGALSTGTVPQLVAQAALPAAVDPTATNSLIITAPRYVDPGPAAVSAIIATTTAFWARPTNVALLTATTTPGPAQLGGATSAGLPAAAVAAVEQAGSVLRLMGSLSPSATQTVLSGLGPAVQRIESSAWILDPVTATGAVQVFNDQVDSVLGSVHLVRPKTGTYTLASSNSPLPLTVQNNLDSPVQVRVHVSAVNGLPGITADDIGVHSIAAHTTVTLHVPLKFQRSGRFQVQAQLLSPAEQNIGAPVYLSIHSTALGLIGVVITVAAGAVLLIALLVRAVRRIRGGRPAPLAPPTVEP